MLRQADSSVGDQQEVYAKFKEQLHHESARWCETGLRWRGNHQPLQNNEDGSPCRLSTLVRRLKNQGIIEGYEKVVKDQIKEGIVKRETEPVNRYDFNIPLKAVHCEAAERICHKKVCRSRGRCEVELAGFQ